MTTAISGRRLSDYDEMLTRIRDYLSSVKERKLKRKSEILSEVKSLETYLNENVLTLVQQTPGLRPAKHAISKTLISLNGIINGLEQDLLKFSDYRKTVATSLVSNYNWLKLFRNSLSQEQEVVTDVSNEAIKKTSKEHGFKAAIQQLTNVREESDEADAEEKVDTSKADAETAKLLSSLERQKSKLPTSLKGKAFQLIRVPIVVNFQSPILNSSAHIRKSGIKMASFATGHRLSRMRNGVTKNVGYEDDIPILLDQTVLAFDINFASTNKKRTSLVRDIERKTSNKERGLNTLKNQLEDYKDMLRAARDPKTRNTAAIKEYLEAISEIKIKIQALETMKLSGSTLPSRKQAINDIEQIQNFLLEFMELLNASSSVKYTVVSDHYAINPLNPNIRLAWLMPTSQYKAYIRGSSNTKGTWNFPWKSEKVQVL